VIEWNRLAGAALWIAGLSVLLAGISYHDWWRREHTLRWSDVRRAPSWQLTMSAGMVAFCAGVAAANEAWTARVVWGILAAVFMLRAIAGARQSSRSGSSTGP
jgi:hypothetical protein